MVEMINLIPKPLTEQERFRLVEIAHETTHVGIKELALALLEQSLYPAYFIAPKDPALTGGTDLNTRSRTDD